MKTVIKEAAWLYHLAQLSEGQLHQTLIFPMTKGISAAWALAVLALYLFIHGTYGFIFLWC